MLGINVKIKLASAVLLCLCVSFPAYAAKIIIPDSFEFLALDGQKVKRGILSHISSLELSEGEHKLALRYADAVEDPNMRYPDYLHSKPILLTLTAEGQHTYKLVPDPVAIKQPWSYMDHPIITIVRQDGGPVSYAAIPPKTEEDSLVAATKVDSNENTTSVVAAAATSQPKAQSTQPDAADSAPSPADSTKGSNKKGAAVVAAAGTSQLKAQSPQPVTADPAQSPAGSMLKYWWSQADEKTRRDFMNWAAGQ
jgi:uncharacterized protein YccT (UPF0319 family)